MIPSDTPSSGANRSYAATKKDSYLQIAAPAALLLVTYLLLYFVCVIDGQFKAVPDPRYMRTYTVSGWVAAPYYRGFPSALQGMAQWGFAPVHYLDRRVLRPGKWSGRIRFPVAPPPPAPAPKVRRNEPVAKRGGNQTSK